MNLVKDKPYKSNYNFSMFDSIHHGVFYYAYHTVINSKEILKKKNLCAKFV